MTDQEPGIAGVKPTEAEVSEASSATLVRRQGDLAARDTCARDAHHPIPVSDAVEVLTTWLAAQPNPWPVDDPAHARWATRRQAALLAVRQIEYLESEARHPASKRRVRRPARPSLRVVRGER